MRPLHSGVQEYTVNLLTALFQASSRDEFVLFSSGRDEPIKSAAFEKILAHFKRVHRRHLHVPNRLLNRGFQFLAWPKLDKFLGAPDLFFAPNFGYWALSRRTPLVTAVHDLSFLRNPEFFSWRGQAWAKFVRPAKLAQKAAHLIAMSESTKADIIEFFKVPPEKVSVVYSGILPQFRPLPKSHDRLKASREKYRLPGRYILALGTLEPRKNLGGLIRAYALLNARQPDAPPLVIAGPRGWLYEEILAAARRSPAARKIFLPGPIQEADRVFVYNSAALFVYPSFLEGFGFPPLEAMACGVPVVTSHTSSLPEAVGTAAITVDPHRIEDIALAMQVALTDKALRERLVKAGFDQARRFTWVKAAQETLAVFRKVAGS